MNATIIELIRNIPINEAIKNSFIERAKIGALTRDENAVSHFCVYFAAYDPKNKLVFIGHHKKTDLWLFNGGHIDENEAPNEALEREICEEWGKNIELSDNLKPSFLSITEIDNPMKQACQRHYDIWYFISLNKNAFAPDEKLLVKEFYQCGWKTLDEARKLVNEPTLSALIEVEKLFK